VSTRWRTPNQAETGPGRFPGPSHARMSWPSASRQSETTRVSSRPAADVETRLPATGARASFADPVTATISRSEDPIRHAEVEWKTL
jgi:hypothetical protein